MKRLKKDFGDDEDEEGDAPTEQGQGPLLITQGHGEDKEEQGKGKELQAVASKPTEKRKTKVTPKRQKTTMEKPPKVQPITRVHI